MWRSEQRRTHHLEGRTEILKGRLVAAGQESDPDIGAHINAGNERAFEQLWSISRSEQQRAIIGTPLQQDPSTPDIASNWRRLRSHISARRHSLACFVSRPFRKLHRLQFVLAVVWVFLAVAFAIGQTSYGAGKFELADDSPLASDERQLFAVAADKRTIVARLLHGTSWTRVAKLPVRRVDGLAYRDGFLYLVDGEEASLHRLHLSTLRSETIYRGEPLQKPDGLAWVRDSLFISDSGAGTVFRLSDFGSHNPEPIWTGQSRGERIFLAGSDTDLIISSPASGAIIRIERANLLNLSRRDIVQRKSKTDEKSKSSTPSIRSSETKVTTIAKPSAVAYLHGIVYVIDAERDEIFAFSPYDRLPARLVVNQSPISEPKTVVATSEQIFTLDDKTDDVTAWPRLVPVEIRIEGFQNPVLGRLSEYLYRAGLLPVKRLHIEGNLKEWVTKESILRSNFEQWEPVICALNTLCSKGKFPKVISADTVILVPDIYAEQVIDVHSIELKGKNTFGEQVDAQIYSVEFDEWKTEAQLRRLNPRFEKAQADLSPSNLIRDARKGVFSAPIESTRLIVAMPAREFQDEDSELAVLRQMPGVRFVSREEVVAQAYSIHQDAASEASVNWQDLADAYDKMRTTINYTQALIINNAGDPYIGVPESEIDCENPDLGAQACQTLVQEISPVAASVVVPREAESFKVREFEKTDHGTAVAAIIGARNTRFQRSGIAAPYVHIVPLHRNDPGLGNDVREAYLNTHVRIFNFSFNFTEMPENLSQYMVGEDAYKDALFVVAAGNEAESINCNSKKIYPVCWGDQQNILVVGATTLDGRSLIDVSNRGARFVHVAAPGEGFHASGRNQSYVPVRGTSFAAPLVTATAALLFAEGLVDPWLIKQRIIATSDISTNLEGQIQGGLLHVKRATSFLNRAVIKEPTGEERPVRIIPQGKIHLKLVAGERSIPISDLRRLTLNTQTSRYRAIYVDQMTKELKIVSNVTFEANRRWKFKYFELNDPNVQKEGDMANLLDYVGPIQ